MENKNVVNEELTILEEVAPQEEVMEETPAPGSKTDSEMLLKSLKDERAKRALIEEENRLLQEQLNNLPNFSEPEVFSDEGKALQSKIDSLGSEISELRGQITKKDVLITYPTLKDKWAEFDEFRSDPENKGMNLKTAAKAFLVENGLLPSTPRKGLEKATGGDRIPATTGYMTAEEVKTLRTTNFRKYTDMLSKGLIKIKS